MLIFFCIFRKPQVPPNQALNGLVHWQTPHSTLLCHFFGVSDIAEPLATELDSSDKDSGLKQMRAEQLVLQKKIAAKEVSSFQSYANIALFSF